MEYRSDLLKFRRVTEEMRLSVTNVHLELMNRTPFGRLFKAYRGNLIIDGVCRKCDANIVSILKCCDLVQKAFVLGGITATITAKDIAEIFGLSDEGEEINLNSRRRKSAFIGFYGRCLVDVKDISKKILEERILRVVKMHGSVHEGDFVRLVRLYFCLTLFFSTSGNNTSLYMVGYVEDITKMKDYACTVAVKNWLLGTIDNMGERYESVTNCVIGLLRTHLINPIRGRKNMPLKVVKWNLSELYAKLEIMKIHELEEVVQVGGGSPKTPETKKKIIQLRSHGGGINVEPHKENYIVKDKSPKQNSMILQVKSKQRKPLLMPDYKVSMWKGEHCAMIRDDILALLNEGGVIDSFFEILNDDQIGIPKDQLKYGFMSTFAWHMKDSISRKLNENSICKHIMKSDKVHTLLYTLSHDDREFLMWLRQTNVEYPLKANISCLQQFPNIYDCGVAMMYIAQKKS
ncbi:unnamed protein product [Malus baccata var. baccata]